ncbi:hypothetical protein JYK14_06335 [Siccirubricoccus sp. KC 17139]|uniref:Restriction endonuclease type IV Mrr domain-containing protein n=1 Tax=Siccirubricoccus soli TaxID=2899147 RepID=A0ABT1D3D3_9PROT|nr:hypothetical protein [Siccirubricoccus soli]MCO6415795.1 hypothetical protein [Siccirubricoccus soli]MCP2681927.1 hypothetical protein [Siccirubricoccus soli]
MINPRVNPALPPAFHEMAPATFEEMTCALMSREPDISRADLYRISGQKQYGIDVLADREDGRIEVASCKCYDTLKKGDLGKFSDEFLKHWDMHWKGRPVRRFVLAVSVDVHSAQRDAEVQQEKARFAKLGVEYEVWAPRQLQERLRPWPGIVSQFMTPEHVSRLCGQVASPLATSSPVAAVADGVTDEALRDLSEALSRQVGHRLDHLLDRLRSGETPETEAALRQIVEGPEWSNLHEGTKARVLRLQASARLHNGDDEAAWRLAEQADAFEHQKEPRLRALLTCRRDGTAAALAVLGEPETQDGAHLKAALLLDSHDVAGCLAVLDGHVAVTADHPETLRLRSLAALTGNERETALGLAEAAAKAAPDWPSVQWALAIACYASALSPAVKPDRFMAPNPVLLDLVCEDDTARALLAKALGIFDTLTEKERTDAERRSSEIFALACLCNLRDRFAEAEGRVREMLARRPASAPVVAWALGRGVPVDTGAVSGAIRSLLSAGEADTEQVLLLAMLEDMEGRTSEAVALLEGASTLFERTEETRQQRDTWLAELRRRISRSLGDAAIDPNSPAGLEALTAAASASGDWGPLEDLFDKLANEAPVPPMALLPVAQALAVASRWEALAKRTDALLTLATPEPIRIACYACVHTGRHQLALDILRDRRGAFAHGRLPSDLARLQVEALARAGNPADAVRLAVSLATAEAATPQDAVTAAVAHIRTGNIQAAVPFVDAANRAGALQAREALGLAQAVSPVDPSVAAALWQRAVAGQPEPGLIPAALGLAFRLGLEREAAPLLGALGQLSGLPDSGVTAFSHEDLIRFVQERREAGERISRMHLKAELPVHLAAHHGGANLVHLYSLDNPPECGRGDYPVLMLHGIRSAPDEAPCRLSDGPIHMDVTALLVVDQLGMLDVLERIPNRVLLPPSLPAALVHLEDSLRHQQPRRLAAMRKVLDLAVSGRIAKHGAGSDGRAELTGKPACSTGCLWVVDFSRGKDETRSEEPPIVKANVRGVIDALLAHGELDPEAHSVAVGELGQEGARPSLGAPVPGDAVVLAHGLAVGLAEANVLDAVAAVFKTSIDVVDFGQIETEVKAAEVRSREADRMASLRSRVSRALTSGTLGLLPESRDEETEDGLGPVGRCLADIVRTPGVPGGLTWVDDRLVNGHAWCGVNRVVGTPQVLAALVAAGHLPPAARWSALLRLRAARAMFLPISVDEVIHHLLAAPVVNGELVETPALATLRQYVAWALEQAPSLVVSPALSGTGPGEVPFLLALRRLAESAVLTVWLAEDRTDEERLRLSSWIWTNLRVDRLPDVGLPGTAPGAWRTLLGHQYAGLLANGIQIVLRTSRAGRVERLRSFMAWAEEFALPNWLWSDAQLVDSVARMLRHLLGGLVERDRGPRHLASEEKRYAQAAVGRVVVELPRQLQRSLVADQRFCRAVGVRTRELVWLGNAEFESNALWKACASAMQGNRTSTQTADGRSTLRLRRKSGARLRLELSGALRGIFDDPALGLVSTRGDVRRRAAQEVAAKLCLSPVRTADATAEMLRPQRAADRMDAVMRFRLSSPALRYAHLRQRLSTPEPVPWEEFDVGDPAELLRHIGIQPSVGGGFGQRLPAAALSLLRDFGAAEAVRRLASLPVPLSAEVIEAACALPRGELRRLLDDLSGRSAPPIHLLHCVRLHRALLESSSGDADAFGAAVGALANRWKQEASLLLLLLKQTGEALRPCGDRAPALRADEALAAAWLHADQVTAALLGAGHDPQKAHEGLRKRRVDTDVSQTITRCPAFDREAASPASLTSEALLFHGLGYALGTEASAGPTLLGNDVLDTVRELLSIGAEPNRAPSPWLLSDRESGTNELGSWFQSRPAWLFHPFADLSREGAAATFGSTLVDLGTTSGDKSLLWVLMGALSWPGLDEERRSLALGALQVADFPALVDADSTFGFAALRGAVDFAQVSESTLALEMLEDQLLRIAAGLARKHHGRVGTAGPATRALSELVETAGALSRHCKTADGWQHFGVLAVKIADAWPGATGILRDLAGALATAARPDVSDGLHQAWISLRGRR